MSQDIAFRRLNYHFEPPKGWMNDPNGLIEYNGKYHIFYQHNPKAPKWDKMHWGHAVSYDLIHWEHLPIALYPFADYEDEGGCFSGSAIEKDGKVYMFYTGVSYKLKQVQCLAIMDNNCNITKYEGNPIIPGPPEGIGEIDFRDPKVTKIGDNYYMVVGTGKDKIGKVLMYKSQDLIHWDFQGVVTQGENYGICAECPDLMTVKDRVFLMFSQMTGQGIGTMIWSGKMEGDMFKPEKLSQPIKGPDFYAPQSFLDSKGRRIIIGWLYNWKRQPPPGLEYAGALTIPLEVTPCGDTIKVFPVEEARQYLTKGSKYVDIEANKVTIKAPTPIVYEGKVESVDILEDTKTVEVFINGGEVYYSTWII